MINTAPNSPWKGFYPNVNPFGISERYGHNINTLYNKFSKEEQEGNVIDSIKGVKREDANLEAEKGESLLSFKEFGTALHKIQGKPHSKGGTPLNLQEGSFIFSNDKDMSLTEDEIKTFNLGKFQKGGLVNNTPAKVLERNVDFKHNNKMLDYLNNSKNYAEKTTALKMLQKYQEKIATIAALQEIRKDTELPKFAAIVPPDPQRETEEIRQKQYSKGGWYLPKAQQGQWFAPMNPQNFDWNTILGKSTDYKKEQPNDSETYNDVSSDISWLKPFNWNPTKLSMLANTMQGIGTPRIPGLALSTAPQFRAQTFDEQPGINAALSQAYAARKASNQYASPQLQTGQLYDTQAVTNAQNYASQINKMNMSTAADIANKNIEMSTNVANQNRQSLASFQDKMNEMRQNIADNKRMAAVSNINVLGEAIRNKEKYDMATDLMKRYQPYNVAKNMSSRDISDSIMKAQEIINKLGITDAPTKAQITNFILKQMQPNNNNQKTFEEIMSLKNF